MTTVTLSNHLTQYSSVETWGGGEEQSTYVQSAVNTCLFKADQYAKKTQFGSSYPGKQPFTNKLGLNCGISVQGQQAMEKVQTIWLKRSSLKDQNILIWTLPQMGAREWGDELCSAVLHLFFEIIQEHIFCTYSLEMQISFKKNSDDLHIRSGLPEKISACFNLYIDFNRCDIQTGTFWFWFWFFQ